MAAKSNAGYQQDSRGVNDPPFPKSGMGQKSAESYPGISTVAEPSRFWDFAPGWLLFLFALAAPWSIAIAQWMVVGGAVFLVVGSALRRLRVPRPPLSLLLIVAFLAFQAISIPLGVHPERSLRCFKGSWVLLFPFVFWGLAQEERDRRRAFFALIGSGAAAGLYGVIQHLVGIDYIHHRGLEYYGGGGYLAVGNLNSHLTYAGVLLPIFLLALGTWLGRLRRLDLAGAALLLGLGLLFSYTRTAWVGAVAGLAVLGLWRGRRAFLAVAGTLLVIVAGAAWVEPAMRQRIGSILDVGSDPRSRLWQTALRIVAEHPWTGAGLGSYKTQFPLFKVPGEYLSTVHPHSDPLNVLVETGILGALAWLSIWFFFFRETRAPRELSGPGRRRSVSAGVFLDPIRAGVVALLIAGLGQCYSTDEEVAQVWWFLVAAGLWEARAARERSADPHVRGIDQRRRTPWREFQRSFKARTLPLAARLLVARAPAGRTPTATERRRERPARILVVRSDNRLGNLLLLTPFLQRLREAEPEANIALLSGEAFAPLLRGWPWIDEGRVQEKRKHASRPWLFPSWLAGLRAGKWDLAFEASNPNTHSYYNCLLTLASGAPERIGFDHPRSADVLTTAVAAPSKNLHFSLASLSLLRALGMNAPATSMSCPLPDAPSAEYTAWKRQAGLREAPLLLHLGGRDQKAWPLSAWAGVIPRLLEEWDGRVVLVAGPSEQDRLASLLRRPDSRVLRAPKLRLTDLAHLIRDSALYLGCDSGVLHLAVSLGTPTVALFFRSNPYHYAPLGPAHRTVLLANPYGVTEEEWEKPVEGMVRGRLLWAESSAERSRVGQPETGRRAIEGIAAAVLEGQGRTSRKGVKDTR